MSDFVFINDYKFSLGVRELAIVDGTGQILLTIDENWTGSVYPRSDGEVAAGVDFGSSAGDIVNSALPPGDVRRYGAVAGEAATATTSVNTAAIQAALNSNGLVWFEAGQTYMVGQLYPDSNQIIDFNGATLKLLAGSEMHTQILRMSPEVNRSNWVHSPWYRSGVTTLTDVIVRNGFLDGNIANNLTPAYDAVNTTLGAGDGNGGIDGMHFCSYVSQVKIENVTASNFFTDGFNFSHANVATATNRATDVTMVDCVSDTNARQGLSIVAGADLKFTRCKFINTQAIGSVANNNGVQGGSHKGASNVVYNPIGGPFAGVDIENYHPVNNVTFTSCSFTGNNGTGFQHMPYLNDVAGYVNRDIIVNECYCWNNTTGTSTWNGASMVFMNDPNADSEGIIVSNCIIEKLLIKAQADSRVDIIVSSCQLGDMDTDQQGLEIGPFAPASLYSQERSSVQINNCVIIGSTPSPYVNQDRQPVRIGACTSVDITFNGGSITNLSAGSDESSTALYVGSPPFPETGDNTNNTNTVIRINGTRIKTNSTAIVIPAGVDLYLGGGATLEVGDWGVQIWGGTDAARPARVFTTDATIIGATVGLRRSQDQGYLQINGTRFIGCAQDTNGPNIQSELRGSGVPTMNAAVGSVYHRDDPANANEVLYVCYPADTWVAK